MEHGNDYFNQPDMKQPSNQAESQDAQNSCESPEQQTGQESYRESEQDTNVQFEQQPDQNVYNQSGQQYGQNTYNQPEQQYGQNVYNQPGQQRGQNTYNQSGQQYGQNAYNQPGQQHGQNVYGQPGQQYNQNVYGQNANYNSGMGYGVWQKPVDADGRPLENRYGMKLIFSILEIISCNLITIIMGIIGCVYTSKANSAYTEGRWQDYKSHAKTSAICLWTGLGAFVLGVIFMAMVWIFGGLGTIFMDGFWEGYYGSDSSDSYSFSGDGKTVYVDETYISIPLTYSEIESIGFSLDSYDRYETLEEEDFGLYGLQNRDGDTVCWGWFYNDNSWETDLTDCIIIGIDVDYNCENYETFQTNEGLGFFDSKEDYIRVYGEPDRKKRDGYSEILYWYFDNGSDSVWRVMEVTFEGDIIYDIDIDYK